jgi:hypothetical protein
VVGSCDTSDDMRLTSLSGVRWLVPFGTYAVFEPADCVIGDDYSATGAMLITTDFEAGVLLFSATLRIGTKTLASGK